MSNKTCVLIKKFIFLLYIVFEVPLFLLIYYMFLLDVLLFDYFLHS